MNTLDIVIDLNLNPVKRGSGYNSQCPFCGGNDRFIIWPDKGEYGAWYCRGCQKSGDAIQLLRDAKGMDFKAACELLGKTPAKRRSASPRPATPKAPNFIPREISGPADLWQAKAAAFAEWAHEQLLKNADQIAWLSARGITVETARRFKLGWNPKKLFNKRTTWGMPEDTASIKIIYPSPLAGEGRVGGNAAEANEPSANAMTALPPVDPAAPPAKTWRFSYDKKREWLCLPAGLVIPCAAAGHVYRLRIRRPEPDIEQRYYVVPGSAMQAMKIPPSTQSEKKKEAWVIVESELDAILIAQDAGDIVGAAALGSVALKPDSALYAELRPAASILVALDADHAGAKSWPWWQTHFPQADRWPVPSGKDPSDYKKAGGDIRAWMIAGLPPGLRPAPEIIKSSRLLDPAPLEEESISKKNTAPPPWTLINSELLGECIVIVRDRANGAAAQAANPGLAVYTPAEVALLKKHSDEPGYKEKLADINRVKKVFGGKLINWEEAK